MAAILNLSKFDLYEGGFCPPEKNITKPNIRSPCAKFPGFSPFSVVVCLPRGITSESMMKFFSLWIFVVYCLLEYPRVSVKLSPLDNFYKSKMAAKMARNQGVEKIKPSWSANIIILTAET